MTRMTFIQRIENNVLTSPDKVILSDERGEYTNWQLWELSGRMYAYLLEQQVGREDIVLLHLPRGAQAVMAMVGVFRAGAAVVILEDWSAEDRSTEESSAEDFVDYVLRDVQPRLVIDSAAMGYILRVPPQDGYRLPDLHDLAYITYTTGTTGQRKGVMHEYGTIERYAPSDNLPEELKGSYSVALVVTLHSGLLPQAISIADNAKTDIVPRGLLNDWPRFIERLEKTRCETTYMAPSYYKKYGIPQTPFLKYISVSFEPVCDIWQDGTAIVNEYGATETGTTVTLFQIDRHYDITPIGKPLPRFNVSILDEHDRPVPDGEFGEICVDNTYCRGYLNLPESTAEHFRGGLYHTHDLGKRLPDGNYIMYGRINDTLRTEKGWIIALEIEVQARKLLGHNTVYVKVFPTGGDPVICLYTDFPIDFPSLQTRLSDVLPEYEIPTDHVRVDRFQSNNGKVIRIFLKNPHQ